MSKDKRNKNRLNAKLLQQNKRAIEEKNSTCPNCQMTGEFHWVNQPMSLQGIINGSESGGFWICPKMYGPDGRRIGADPNAGLSEAMAMLSLLSR